jgi:hypothetical protein
LPGKDIGKLTHKEVRGLNAIFPGHSHVMLSRESGDEP